MEAKLIQKPQLEERLRQLAEKAVVYAPVREGHRVHFRQLEAGQEACLDFTNSANAPKNLFFPQTETLMRFARTDRGMELVAAGPEGEGQIVLFGVRPCDVRSFKLLDLVFDQEKYSDPYYVARRQRTTIVAFACKKPAASTCFCTSVGGHPARAEGADILVSELEQGCLVEFQSAKGEALAEYFSDCPDAGPELIRAREKQAEAAASLVNGKVPAAAIKPWLDANFDHPFWDRIHHACLGCGTCSYLCPTCHCFDIRDEMEEDRGVRLRTWDTCMYSVYTKETSGHNPRPSQKERWRQRLMHKFKYFVDNHGEISCVGCGRCVSSCPVNMDIRKLIEAIAELQEKAGKA